MKTARWLTVLSLVFACGAPVRTHAASPVGNAFTYQGSLQRNGGAVNGTCDFQFSLYDTATGGTRIGGVQSFTGVSVSGGLFTAAPSFGPGAFDGNARWLEIAVRGPGDAGFTTLTPRQLLTPAPYALWAPTSGGGGGLTLPFSGGVTSSSADAFAVQQLSTSGAVYAMHAKSAATVSGSGALFAEATGTTGLTLGLYADATASATGTGAVGKGGVTGGWFEAMSTANTSSGPGVGLWGTSHASVDGGTGVFAQQFGTAGLVYGLQAHADLSPSGEGVFATGTNSGVHGKSTVGSGVYGESSNGSGIAGFSSNQIGVSGFSNGTFGVEGSSFSATGMHASSNLGRGLFATSSHDDAVLAQSAGAGHAGVSASSSSATGYGGYFQNNAGGVGAYATANQNDGLLAQSAGAGHAGVSASSSNSTGYGGYFQNSAGGVALFANGLAQVKTLQILGADLAESFPVKERTIEPGSVVMIDDGAPGSLRTCDESYSHRVAGVVSGANGLDAAVVLKGRSFDERGHAAVAMSGRVWVKCDATRSPIHPGDLLTTSPRPGHAMRADDHERAYGAILGKAMTSLETGTGFVLVLVNLQ